MIHLNPILCLFVVSIQVLSINAAGNGSDPKEIFMKKILSKSKLVRKTSYYDGMFTEDNSKDYSSSGRSSADLSEEDDDSKDSSGNDDLFTEDNSEDYSSSNSPSADLFEEDDDSKDSSGNITSFQNSEEDDDSKDYYYSSDRSSFDNPQEDDDSEDYISNSSSFDISQFSVKFHSCASLSEFDFDDFQHENKDNYHDTYPYTSTQVVNYRLCPTDYCQDDSWDGCKNVYGTHVITLEDYFEAKKDYEDYLKESLKKQCDYCEECDYFYKKYGEKCTYYDSCSNYVSKDCDKYDQGRDTVDYSEYLECTRVDVKNEEREKREENYKKTQEERKKQQEKAKEEAEKKKEERKKQAMEQYGYYNETDDDDYVYEEDDDDFYDWLSYQKKWVQTGKVYIKVYCDGELKVGIFSDSKCSKYIGDQVSIEKLTGLKVEEDDLKNEFDEHDCISCQTEIPYEEREVIDMCKNMYEDAVKCNMNIPVDYSSFDEKEMDEWDETVSGTVCSMIEDIEEGNIDKYGILSSSNFTQSPTMSPTDSNSTEEVTSSYMGTATYYSTTNSSNYSSNNTYDAYNSSFTGHKTIKDYQTDFTNTINNKFLSEGHYITQVHAMYAGWAFLVTLVAVSGCCLYRLGRNKNEDDSVRSDLMKNEGGFMA